MLSIEEREMDRMTEMLYNLLNGKPAEKIELPSNYINTEFGQFVAYFNRFIEEYGDFTSFGFSLSRGDLNFNPPKGRTQMLQSFKSLQANLKHLTWKTQQIARGDFSHKVDFMGDFSDAFNDMTHQLADAFEKIQEQNIALTEANRIIEYERAKAEGLLENILPPKIIDELKSSGSTTPLLYKDVAVYFSDIVGFTKKATLLDPAELINELNSIFAQFDCIVDSTYGERIKTIGDAYIAVWGMHTPLENPEEHAVKAALRILECLNLRNSDSEIQWEIRIGIHKGDVVGGVVGLSKFIYDIFGDTVNTASRLESSSEPMKISISEQVFERIKDRFVVTERGLIHAKGKGNIKMYFVEGLKNT